MIKFSELNTLGLTKCKFKLAASNETVRDYGKKKDKPKYVPSVCKFTAAKDGEVYCVARKNDIVSIIGLQKCHKPRQKRTKEMEIKSEELF